MKRENGSTLIVLSGALVLVLFLGLLFAPYTIVGAGEVGVVTVLGKVQSDTLPSGFHIVSPMAVVKKIDTRIQKETHDYAAASKDLQAVAVSATLNYRVLPESANDLFRKVGMEFEDRIILPRAAEALKAEIALHNATEILEQRPAIKMVIQNTLAKELAEYGIMLDGVSLSNISFSKEYEAAIERKQLQEQATKQKEYELQQTKLQAEMSVASAKGAADSKKLEADAMAYYNEKTAKALTTELLQMKYYEKWDGKLPQYILGDKTAMLMQFPGK